MMIIIYCTLSANGSAVIHLTLWQWQEHSRKKSRVLSPLPTEPNEPNSFSFFSIQVEQLLVLTIAIADHNERLKAWSKGPFTYQFFSPKAPSSSTIYSIKKKETKIHYWRQLAHVALAAAAVIYVVSSYSNGKLHLKWTLYLPYITNPKTSSGLWPKFLTILLWRPRKIKSFHIETQRFY